MVERAILTAIIAGALLGVLAVAQAFHPLELAAEVMTSLNCPADWSAEACEAAH